jgi:hypothetical protein
MRAAILLLLMVVALAAPVISQTPDDDKLIVPGDRIGKWTLKMTLDELEKMNGPAFDTRVQFFDFRGEAFFYVWPSLDFGVSAYKARRVEWFVAGFGGSVPWKTEKGIGLQNSTRAEILKAYGEPTVETVPRLGQKNMIYDAIGIDFQVYDSGGAIREMRVFPPGTAKNIWKF